MPAKQLKTFLDEAGLDYMCLAHPPAFTAQELAFFVYDGFSENHPN